MVLPLSGTFLCGQRLCVAWNKDVPWALADLSLSTKPGRFNIFDQDLSVSWVGALNAISLEAT